MDTIKAVSIRYPDEAPIEIELIVGRYDGPKLRAKKVIIPIGTTLELGPGFWTDDPTPALGVAVGDGIGTKDRFGG